MKLNKKVLAVTAILAVGILAGCGSSNSTAGSAASAPASGVESSAASSEAAGEMGDVLPIDAGDLNEIKTGSYKFAASITKVADGQATLSVYGYDSYLPEDIDALQEGSVLRIHDQGDTTVTKLTVTSIDRDADNGYVTINGGIEAGGVELTLDHDVYRTVTFDDYPVYYEMGEVTLPLAGGVTLSDSSAAGFHRGDGRRRCRGRGRQRRAGRLDAQQHPGLYRGWHHQQHRPHLGAVNFAQNR